MRAALVAVAAGGMLMGAVPAHSATPRPARAIDGDTVVVGSTTVRLVGVDTPEHGRCGFRRATRLTARMISDGVRLRHISGVDRYGRTLAYVTTADGRDVGAVLLRRGLAVARYDARDGFPAHPRQTLYRRLDARHDAPGVCV